MSDGDPTQDDGRARCGLPGVWVYTYYRWSCGNQTFVSDSRGIIRLCVDIVGQIEVTWATRGGMADEIPIQSAGRVLEVLEVLADRGGATLSEVESALGLPRSTAHDYLTTLHALQYVVKRDSQYRVSTRPLAIGVGSREHSQLYQLAKPELDALAEQTGEHVSLMIEEHGLGVLLYIVKGDQALDLGVYEGWRMALSTNAPGKAILAHLSDDRVEAIVEEHGLPEVTASTVTDRKELYDRLETVRERGYALDFGERLEGVRAVSVPIVTDGRVHGSITVSGPTNRMGEERVTEQLPDLLFRSGNVIEIQYTLDSSRS